MITGYNSDIEFDGKVFHVQTEDKGLNNPVVETLVYSGGQVVASVVTPYDDLADSPDYTQDRIQRRMQQQHRSLIADLERGRLDPEPVVRRQAVSTHLDADHLIDEYVEHLIDSSALIEPVHRALETDIETIRNREKVPHPRGQKKKVALLTLLVVAGGIYAAFELGRLSLRPDSAAPEAPPEIPVQVETRSQVVETDSLSVTARGLESPLFGAPIEPEPAGVSEEDPASTTAIEERIEAIPEPEAPAGAPMPSALQEEAIDQEPVPVVVDEAASRLETVPVRAVLPTPQDPAVVEEAVDPEAVTRSVPLTVPEPEPIQPPEPGNEPFEAHEVEQPPTSMAAQLPVYTEAALREAREGRVRMKVLVGKDGNVDAVRLIDESQHSDLNRAAIDAILHWRFNPGLQHGWPVRVWIPARLDFSLSEDEKRSIVSVHLE